MVHEMGARIIDVCALSQNERKVRILISSVKIHVEKFELMSPRIIGIRMKVAIKQLVIIACYAPVNSDLDEIKNAFWNEHNHVCNKRELGER